MKIAFVAIVILHGLVHFMGFAKAFELASLEELTMPVSKTLGLMWLFIALAILSYAALIMTHKEIASWIGFVAIIMSQILIFIYWSDAKWGSIPNLIILIVIIISFGQRNFDQKVHGELSKLSSSIVADTAINVTLEDLSSLPYPVKNWLLHSGIVGRQPVKYVQIFQILDLKMKESDKEWKSAHAVQYSFFDPPAFHWTLDLKMNSFITIRGRDQYVDGQGNILIKMNGLFNIANAVGPEIDEASLQRYLSEIVWIPSFALSDRITWEQIDEHSAKATMSYMGVEGSGVFSFNKAGQFKEFRAKRFKDNGPEAQRIPWIIRAQEYGIFQGIKIPSVVKVFWVIKENEWNWLRVQVEKVHFE